MNSVTLESAIDRNALSKILARLVLRIELINLPDRVVVQRQFCIRSTSFETFIRFGESFIGRAAAVDDHTGPGSRIHMIVLPGPDVNAEQRDCGWKRKPDHGFYFTCWAPFARVRLVIPSSQTASGMGTASARRARYGH